jgi:ATP-dependent Lhr-like helicase
MDPESAEKLITFLKKQKEATGCDLPHRHHLLIEYVSAGPGSTPGNQVLMHTQWGGRVNRPFAMALDAAWEARYGHRLEVFAGNDCVALLLPHDIGGAELLSLVTDHNVEALLRKRLEGSGFFGARFRECAGRALILTRKRINERLPLWMSRLRSQKLLDSVLQYEDFPILLEAWRTCLQDEFDLEGLGGILSEFGSGVIEWSEARMNHPSPMAQSVTWRQVSQYMYRGDEPMSGKRSRLRSDLVRDVAHTPGLRPSISPEIVLQFESKRQRLSPGYSPVTSQDLLDWVKERLMIPMSEWESLLAAVGRDYKGNPAELLQQISNKLVRIGPEKASEPLIVPMEMVHKIVQALYREEQDVPVESMGPSGVVSVQKDKGRSVSEGDPDETLLTLIGEWLRFYGPISISFIGTTLGIEDRRLVPLLETLLDSKKLVTGQLVKEGNDDDICDSENFEFLLRLTRADAIPVFEPIDLEWLPLFIAIYQGAVDRVDNIEGLSQRLEQLLCYRLQAGVWESEIFPSRMHPYDPSRLDALMQEGDLRWIGSKNSRVIFCYESDLDLLGEEPNDGEVKGSTGVEVDASGGRVEEPMEERTPSVNFFPDTGGRYDFSTLLRISKLRPSKLSESLWAGAWQGSVSTDTFMSVRRGIENRFQVPDLALAAVQKRNRHRMSGGRSGFSRWKGSLPFAGNWFRLSIPEFSGDLMEKEERKKDRVRLLLDRYGILFRELLLKETHPFQWSSLFKSLRLMELSGEVLAGYFFHGIPGPQFISHRAFRMLQRKMPEDKIFWINAVDPASLSGVPLEVFKGSLPKRIASTHMAYQGKRLAMVSEGNGKTLTFHVPPDDVRLQEFLEPLRHLLTRRFKPLRRITIERINGEEAARSPYLDALRISFEVLVDYKKVSLYSSATKQ